MFDSQPGEEQTAPSTPAPPPASSPTSKNRDRHGRGRIPDKIQREEVVHDLTEAEKAALGGAENLVELPPERSEQLDWRPSTLFVIVHVRKKYARKEQLPESGLTLAEQNVAVARKPAEAIPGGLAGPGLMAQVIVSKGADHLPLHRLEGIFQRQGVRISRQTMDGWWLPDGRIPPALVRLGHPRGAGFARRPHRRHPVKVRDAWREAEAHGPLLALRGRPAPSADGVRLHADAPTGRAGRVSEGLSRVLAGRRLQRLRRDLPGIQRADHRGGLFGALRGGSSTRAGGWTRPAWKRPWPGSASSTR